MAGSGGTGRGCGDAGVLGSNSEAYQGMYRPVAVRECAHTPLNLDKPILDLALRQADLL